MVCPLRCNHLAPDRPLCDRGNPYVAFRAFALAADEEMPAASASWPNSVRLFAPSLLITCAQWISTVRGLIPSA